MKKQDFIFILVIVAVLLPFFLSDELFKLFKYCTATHPYIMAFIKFALLSTVGDMLGLRIKEGRYTYKGYGSFPRAIVWGLFGMLIALAFVVFKTGVPVMIDTIGSWHNKTGVPEMIWHIADAMEDNTLTIERVIGAFCISVFMNTFFAPVFMTSHKICDTHILNNGGSMKAFIKPIPVGKYINELNWKVQWGFVFKKTIPLFWYPAHTITFLLPGDYQVLFAASLSIFLGVFLSIAAVMSRDKK